LHTAGHGSRGCSPSLGSQPALEGGSPRSPLRCLMAADKGSWSRLPARSTVYLPPSLSPLRPLRFYQDPSSNR
jgi:hypothetical protein